MFEEKYFVQSKVSNYENYRKKKFGRLAEELITFLELTPEKKILDFGCATGGLINELKRYGIKNLRGTDISYWAIEYGKEVLGLTAELQYHNVNLLSEDFDYIFFLDVLEHVPSIGEIKRFIEICSRKDSLIVVRLPVSIKEGEPYYLEVSRNDATHLQCHTKSWWKEIFRGQGYTNVRTLCGTAIYDSKGVLAVVFSKEQKRTG